MNQSVQFSFSKTVVLNSPTHIAIHRNKKKKWKLNHNNFLLFLYPFLSSLIRKGSLTSCEEELREVRCQISGGFWYNRQSSSKVLGRLLLYTFLPSSLLLVHCWTKLLLFGCFQTLYRGGLLKGKTIIFEHKNELLSSCTAFATTFVQDFWLIFCFLCLRGPEDKGNWKSNLVTCNINVLKDKDNCVLVN